LTGASYHPSTLQDTVKLDYDLHEVPLEGERGRAVEALSAGMVLGSGDAVRSADDPGDCRRHLVVGKFRLLILDVDLPPVGPAPHWPATMISYLKGSPRHPNARDYGILSGWALVLRAPGRFTFD